MNKRPFIVGLLVLALAAPVGVMTTAAHAQPIQPGFTQERPWDQAPDDYRDAKKAGFQDGIEAARHDWSEHRHKDADDHDRYKHPPVAGEFRDDYREGFKHGYSEAMHHMKDMREEDKH